MIMISQILQKMQQKKESNTPLESIKSVQGVSICNELHLDIQNLNNQELMSNPTYRRLYNIVKNDMSRSVFQFRKNLIKELYFLLQIMPIIKPDNKEQFILEVQKLYNLNDHKKIELASNKMNRLLNDVHMNTVKEGFNWPVRPKSGVEWNQKISPFLRPYTAQRPPKTTSSKNGKILRPQSSKFGNQSTKNQTQAQTEDIYIRQFTTNIQEQLDISKDFVKGHRTIHPMQEPIYEQLYNIFKKIETNPAQTQQQQPKPQRTNVNKYLRYTKSAMTRKINLKTQNIEKEDNRSHHQNENNQSFDHNQNKQDNIQEREESEKSSEEEYLYVSDKKEITPYRECVNIEGQKDEKVGVNEIEKLDKYHFVIQNKLVQAINEDNEMAVRYIDFARQKSSQRKEFSRKAESKRLMSAKPISAKYIKLKRQEPTDAKENIPESKAKIYDFSSNTCVSNSIYPFPTYSKNNFFQKAQKEDVKSYQKDILLIKKPQNMQIQKDKVKRPMTAFVRFHEVQKFDPFSQENIKKHNEQALQEIQKIKMKVGGKFSASTQSLMKVLYIDAHQKIDHTKWQQKSPFYGLVSIGKPKKLKKKGRKLNKSQKITTLTQRK